MMKPMPVATRQAIYGTIQAVTQPVYVMLHGYIPDPFRVLLSHQAEDKNYWQCIINFHNSAFPPRKGTRTWSVATVIVEGDELVVRSWCERVPPDNHHEARWLLADPGCFDAAVGEVFQICLDFCRVHKRRLKSNRVCPHKQAVKEILNNLSERLRRQRQRWLSHVHKSAPTIPAR